MAKKRRGHYCFGCDRYLANERFSGKGHRVHICKKCKSKGKTHKTAETYKPVNNQYRKSLKIRFVAFSDTEGFIFFEIKGRLYAIDIDFENMVGWGQEFLIYRCPSEQDPLYSLANELQKDSTEIIETLLIKCESPYEYTVYLDNYGYDVIEGSEIIQDKHQKYLKLYPELVAFDRFYRAENEPILNIMIIDD